MSCLEPIQVKVQTNMQMRKALIIFKQPNHSNRTHKSNTLIIQYSVI